MNKSVCFTGHRTIAEDKEKLSARLYALLERLVTEQKVTDFYTGGAVGWDALAALTVLKLRESYPEVKLHLVLPCPFEEQSAKWNEAQKAEYLHIFGLVDSVEQVSERYYNGCMKARNARLIAAQIGNVPKLMYHGEPSELFRPTPSVFFLSTLQFQYE